MILESPFFAKKDLKLEVHMHLHPSNAVHIYQSHMYQLWQGLLHDIQLEVLLETDDLH